MEHRERRRRPTFPEPRVVAVVVGAFRTSRTTNSTRSLPSLFQGWRAAHPLAPTMVHGLRNGTTTAAAASRLSHTAACRDGPLRAAGAAAALFRKRNERRWQRLPRWSRRPPPWNDSTTTVYCCKRPCHLDATSDERARPVRGDRAV